MGIEQVLQHQIWESDRQELGIVVPTSQLHRNWLFWKTQETISKNEATEKHPKFQAFTKQAHTSVPVMHLWSRPQYQATTIQWHFQLLRAKWQGQCWMQARSPGQVSGQISTNQQPSDSPTGSGQWTPGFLRRRTTIRGTCLSNGQLIEFVYGSSSTLSKVGGKKFSDAGSSHFIPGPNGISYTQSLAWSALHRWCTPQEFTRRHNMKQTQSQVKIAPRMTGSSIIYGVINIQQQSLLPHPILSHKFIFSAHSALTHRLAFSPSISSSASWILIAR